MSLLSLEKNLKQRLGIKVCSEKKIQAGDLSPLAHDRRELGTVAGLSAMAKDIVDKLYGHVIKSINSDRSRVKLNMFEKAAISSGLNRMVPGTKEYLDGMRHEDIKLLLNDMLGCYTTEMLQEELNKRIKK